MADETKRITLEEIQAQEKFEEQDGVWLPIFLFNRQAGEVKICYLQNEELTKKVRQTTEKYRIRHSYPKGWRPEDGSEAMEDIWREVISGPPIVRDFRGFIPKEGEPELANRTEAGDLHLENLKKLLAMRTIRVQVIEGVASRDNFNKEDLERLAGN
jgi:hypothetical protein